MDNKLDNFGRRAVAYWFVDGLAELSGGVVCLLLAGLFYLMTFFAWSPLTNLLFFLVPFGGGFAIRRILLRIKERSTYPRTGYAAPKSAREDRAGLAVALSFTALLMALMLFLVLHGPSSLVWTPAIGGLILGFIFGWAGYRTGLWRLVFLAGFCLVAGLMLSLTGSGEQNGSALLMVLTSLSLFAFGGLARWTYLHHNPSLPGESNGQ